MGINIENVEKMLWRYVPSGKHVSVFYTISCISLRTSTGVISESESDQLDSFSSSVIGLGLCGFFCCCQLENFQCFWSHNAIFVEPYGYRRLRFFIQSSTKIISFHFPHLYLLLLSWKKIWNAKISTNRETNILSDFRFNPCICMNEINVGD